MIIVTSYTNPDLDGIGAAAAYAELLRAQGKEAVAAFSGVPLIEAKWIMERYTIPSLPVLETVTTSSASFVLVDTSGDAELDRNIQNNRVIEVIDHRAVGDTSKFPHAKIQIELVGAACTLIAERMREATSAPSKQAAILLLGGIISNTMNFCSLTTTPRDEAMRSWLASIAGVGDSLAHDMFAAKTELVLRDIQDAILSDGAGTNLGPATISIGQLEIVGVDQVIAEHYDELRATTNELRQRDRANYVLLNCIDLDAKTTDMLVFDELSADFFSRVIGSKFISNRLHKKGIFLRKQIVPLAKAALQN